MVFSMANKFDPITSSQITITGNWYMYAVLLMLIIIAMLHYIIKALTDFQIVYCYRLFILDLFVNVSII